MNFLIDTNVLIRLEDSLAPAHANAMSAIEYLKRSGHDCQIVPQILYEFWVVATRPLENNGLGLEPVKAETAVREWASLFRLRLDERGVFRHWLQLVVAHEVRGKTGHDARLVAAMQRQGIANLLTFNTGDFARFKTIAVYSPEDILAGRLPT